MTPEQEKQDAIEQALFEKDPVGTTVAVLAGVLMSERWERKPR